MRFSAGQLGNEQGTILVITMLTMAIITLFSLAGMNTTCIEMQIAANDKSEKMAFYAAEAGRRYVERTPDLYGNDNTSTGEGQLFPAVSGEKITLGPQQSFKGSVEYTRATTPPRGSGNSVGKFRAHRYKIVCTGYGPNKAASSVSTGFYRIGF